MNQQSNDWVYTLFTCTEGNGLHIRSDDNCRRKVEDTVIVVYLEGGNLSQADGNFNVSWDIPREWHIHKSCVKKKVIR